MPLGGRIIDARVQVGSGPCLYPRKLALLAFALLCVPGVATPVSGVVTPVVAAVDSTTPVPRVEGPGGYADTVFEQLNEKNGMPGSVAQAIAQDDNGFIWVGTANGASRWDGYRFRTYVMDAGIAGSLPSNNVLTLYVDPQKRLWIGTNRGISLYLPVLDSFQTFTPAGSGGLSAAGAESRAKSSPNIRRRFRRAARDRCLTTG